MSTLTRQQLMEFIDSAEKGYLESKQTIPNLSIVFTIARAYAQSLEKENQKCKLIS